MSTYRQWALKGYSDPPSVDLRRAKLTLVACCTKALKSYTLPSSHFPSLTPILNKRIPGTFQLQGGNILTDKSNWEMLKYQHDSTQHGFCVLPDLANSQDSSHPVPHDQSCPTIRQLFSGTDDPG